MQRFDIKERLRPPLLFVRKVVNIFYSFKGFREQIYGNILASDNILSIPSVDVIVHISSVIVISSIVHHVRPGIPSNNINQVPNPSISFQVILTCSWDHDSIRPPHYPQPC